MLRAELEELKGPVPWSICNKYIHYFVHENPENNVDVVKSNEFELFKSFYHNTPFIKSIETKFLKLSKEYLKCKDFVREFTYTKSNELSEKYRQEGNSYYKKKDYHLGLYNYNLSLLYAEVNNESYGLALGNRSALYYETGKFLACLNDIEQCFLNKYRDTLKPKLYVRKALCLHQLGLTEQTAYCIKEAIKFLETLSITIEVKADILKKLKAIDFKETLKSSSTISGSTKSRKLPKFHCGENEHFLSASSAVSLKYRSDKGRYVIANRDIKQGEILFIEKPYEFVTLRDINSSMPTYQKIPCDNCIKPVDAFYPCDKCSGQIYCQDSCRTQAWESIHKWECAGFISGILYKMGIGNLAFRVFIKGFNSGFTTVDSTAKDDEKQFGCKEDNYKFIYKLMSNVEKESDESLKIYCLVTFLIVLYLQKETNFFKALQMMSKFTQKTDDELSCFIGGLIVKHLLQVSQNASYLSQKFTELPPMERWAQWNVQELGVGLYPSISMMNHSCKPNITCFSNNQYIIVKAFEDIQCGKEVFNCYKYSYNNFNTSERKEELKEFYHFTCRCEECVKPTLSKEIVNSYLCKFCKGPALEDNKEVTCNHCGKMTSISPYLTSFHKYIATLGKFSEDDDNLDHIFKALEISKTIFYKYSRAFDHCYQILLDYYCFKSEKIDMYSILLYANKYISHVSERIGENSSLVCLIKVQLLYDIFQKITAVGCRGYSGGCNYSEYIPKMEKIMKEAETSCYLHFPDEDVHELFENFISLFIPLKLANAIAVQWPDVKF